MATPFVFSPLATPTLVENFTPIYSAKITTSGSSQSITFPTVLGSGRQTFKLTNKGTNGTYIGWGNATATAVASTGTPTANCDYLAGGAILTQDFQLIGSNAVVNTLAFLQDVGASDIEISIGFGQ